MTRTPWHATLMALAACAATASAEGLRAAPAPASTTATARLATSEAVLTLTERLGPDGAMEREYRRSTDTLYRSRYQPLPQGFQLHIVAGHPAQLGTLRLQGQRLSVTDAQGQALWSEDLAKPLCLPEFSAEFVRAHWDRLQAGRDPLPCGVPIIKARKVAPVQWVRLPDGARGERIVELRPGSFGMRFFLSPTRFTFSADGTALLSQEGQFETTPDPTASPRYLKGTATYASPREVPRWPLARFGPMAQ